MPSIREFLSPFPAQVVESDRSRGQEYEYYIKRGRSGTIHGTFLRKLETRKGGIGSVLLRALGD